jgi:hypothetical protein
MKKLSQAHMSVLALAVTACAPLQQAPLVYSSKQTFGVDLSSATTEQPGISLNLGFKSVDAAYVPVAVGRPCTETETIKCEGAQYTLVPIIGGRTVSDSSGTKSAVEQAQQIVAAYDAAVAKKKAADQAASDADKLLTQNRDRVKSLRENLATAETLQKQILAQPAPAVPAASAPVGPGPDAKKAADKVDEIKALLEKAQTDLATSESGLTAARLAAASAQAEVDTQPISKVLDALKVVVTAESKRNDSYSVFGSFSSGTTLGATTSLPTSGQTGADGKSTGATAGVSLGKIFSTGVAAQNLTEGIGAFYAGVGATNFASCLAAVTTRYTATGLLADGKLKAGATDAEKAKLDADYVRCAPRDVKSQPG